MELLLCQRFKEKRNCWVEDFKTWFLDQFYSVHAMRTTVKYLPI